MTDTDHCSMEKQSKLISENKPSEQFFVFDHISGRLLQDRLELVEDLWENVVRSECPVEQADRLLRLKKLSNTSSSITEESNSAQFDEIVKAENLEKAALITADEIVSAVKEVVYT